jgi:3-isopropylmalate/(R)-2-methylmalate dehydratase small subunit
LKVAIDIESGRIDCGGRELRFALTPRERLLLTGDIDWIAATLTHRDRIAAFEAARLARQPWLDRILEA